MRAKILTTILTLIAFITITSIIVVNYDRAPQIPEDQPTREVTVMNGIDMSQVYKNSTLGFTLRHPAGYAIDESYHYQLGLGNDIDGTKFTIPASYATGTNLSEDTYIAVETIRQAPACRADLFLDRALRTQTITENGVTYSVASTTGAAAGNRYEETVYALSDTNPCIAVRYFVHYGVFENYAEGLVQEFEQPALMMEFDLIRRTLVVEQP